MALKPPTPQAKMAASGTSGYDAALALPRRIRLNASAMALVEVAAQRRHSWGPWKLHMMEIVSGSDVRNHLGMKNGD